MAVVVGTWSFSYEAVKLISDKLLAGCECVDALESGINGGFPNSKGVLECDAAVMAGKKCRFGAVAALQGIALPFSVARCVMEKSTHSMLVGQGAQDFAIVNGFPVESNSALQTQKSREAFEEFRRKPVKELGSHDTIGFVKSNYYFIHTRTKHKRYLQEAAAGVSSSGMAFKHPGRVGDSPLPGSGLYADDEVGAAAATGDGDNMMRFCPAFHVVQLMKEGHSPQESCVEVVKEAQRKAGTTAKPFEMALIALNKKGEFGASGTVSFFEDERQGTKYSGFPFVIWTEQMNKPEIRVQPPVCL